MKHLLVALGLSLFANPASQAATIDSISPNSGLTLGGTLVTISGSGLDMVTSVTIGGAPLANVVIVDAMTVTGNTPAGAAGPADVVVTGPSGSVTLPGGFTYKVGVAAQGSALRFDGLDDLVTFGTVSPLSQHTIEAWVKPAGQPGIRSGFVVGHGAGPSAACFTGTFLVVNVADLPAYVVDTAPCGNATGLISGDTPIVGVWTHFAGNYDGDVMRFYVNGVLVGEQSGVPFDPSTWMTAGAVTFFNGQQAFYSGEIDEIRIWNFPRTVQEIQDTMHRPLTGDEPGLVGYWRVDEGSGQQVGDSSSAGITGVLGTNGSVEPRDPVWVASGAPIQQLPFTAPCLLPDPDLFLTDWLIDMPEIFEACNSITAGPNFRIAAGGDVTFRARNSVILANGLVNGFSVDSGAMLTIQLDPLLGSSLNPEQ